MKIAVIGGGITGSVIASELSRVYKNRAEVLLFDQGRRGPGGRASHRSVAKKKKQNLSVDSKSDNNVESEEFVVVPDDHIEKSAFQFDHGCK